MAVSCENKSEQLLQQFEAAKRNDGQVDVHEGQAITTTLGPNFGSECPGTRREADRLAIQARHKYNMLSADYDRQRHRTDAVWNEHEPQLRVEVMNALATSKTADLIAGTISLDELRAGETFLRSAVESNPNLSQQAKDHLRRVAATQRGPWNYPDHNFEVSQTGNQLMIKVHGTAPGSGRPYSQVFYRYLGDADAGRVLAVKK